MKPIKSSEVSEGKVIAPSKKPIDWAEEEARYIDGRDLGRIQWLHVGRLVCQEEYDRRLDIIVKAMSSDKD